MASMTSWNIGDLAVLTAMATKIANDVVYCEHCSVVAVGADDKYCDGCADEVVTYLYGAYYDALAQEYMEAIAADGGLY